MQISRIVLNQSETTKIDPDKPKPIQTRLDASIIESTTILNTQTAPFRKLHKQLRMTQI